MNGEHEAAGSAGSASAGQPAAVTLEAKRALAERLLRKKVGALNVTFAQSYSQRAMWFLHQLDPASTAYHVAFAARVCSQVDPAALKRAVQRLIDRHPALRTNFADGESGPVQVVAGARPAAFAHVLADGWDAEELAAQVRAAYDEPFDLRTGPVLRVTLFSPRAGAECASEHVLLLVAHHIVIDGWSLGIVLNELLAFYAAETSGASPELATPGARYADYVAWQQQLLAGAEGERLWAYWQQELADAPQELALPTDFPRPSLQSYTGGTSVLALSPELTASLRALARAEGVTLFVLLLSAWQLLLASISGQDDILVGAPVAGRSQAAFSGVVGHFVNMVVMRARLPAQLSFRQHLAQVRQKVLNALDYQHMPFALLVERLHIRRDPSRSPLFQVSFDLQKLRRYGPFGPLFVPLGPAGGVAVAGLLLEPYFFPQQEGQYDLALQLAETDDQVFGALKYSTALFRPATVERMQKCYLSILEQIVVDPTVSRDDLNFPIETMDLNTFLAQLRKLDIKIRVEGERLRVNAPAGRVTAELQKEIGRRKEEIVALLQRAASTGGGDNSRPAVKAPAGPLPLSFSQQRLWFLDQMNPGSAAYNIVGAIEYSGELHVAALQRCFSEIVRRHEVLRTRIVADNGEPTQVVDPYRPLDIPLIDLQRLPPPAAEEEALRLIRLEAATPFDLSQSPLLRVKIYRVAADKHLLVVAFHHIAADGWSFGVISHELGLLYPAFAAGEPSPLPPLPLQYGEYAWRQRQQAQGERLEQELDYWKRKLAAPLPLLDLPTDHPRPAVMSTRGRRLKLAWDRKLVDDLQAFSRREGVTLYMTLLAAFNTLLYRYTRQEDILVGSPVAGRTQSETEGLVGFFVNNIVLRSDLSGAPSFRQLLQRVRQVALEAFENQHAPFDRLVETLQPERDPSRSPFFQVLFSLQNMRVADVQLPGVKMREVEIEAGTARFDLSLELWEKPEGMDVHVEYCTDLFEEDTIRRMFQHYTTLLHAALADANCRIDELSLLDASERRQMLVDWNATAADYPRQTPVHRLFEAQAAQRPQAVAVSFAGPDAASMLGASVYTYGELNARANRLARHLQSLGAREGALVGIYMERSCEMLVALLAVHKAGAAYLPLDPAFPSDRLVFMVEDSQTRLVLSQEHLRDAVPAGDAHVVYIDSDWPQIDLYASENLPDEHDGAAYDPQRLAYVLYTSGSTGRPKGVQVQQAALVNFLTSMQRAPGMAPTDVLLSVTTLSFDIAGLEIFLPLITGAQVVMVSHSTAADGAALLQVLRSCDATVMQATPATWRLLISAGWEGAPKLKILCGGEAMPGELANQLLARCASLWNMYGPTETTIWSTIYRVTMGEGIMPIGRPIANTTVYVLDDKRQPVPAGVAGELYIGGDGVALGYLNRPELTAEKFLPDPFAGGDARMYRTGDLVRYRASGDLDFLGRIDFQVKIRGFRIELGEIEAVLDEHPAIRQAVVVAREDAPGERRLVAYLALAAAAPAAGELRSYLKGKLPDYMAPAVFVTVDEFPLTPNGKVNRKALPAPQTARVELSAHYVAPRSEIERQVAAIWQSVLNVERVGVTDNFFDLGGHSLLIVQVHNSLRRQFETDLTIAQMFQYPTVETLAAHLQRPQAASSHLQQAQERAARQRAQLERPLRHST